MLKALELAGFKSFADKTRFEFPQGITVVVGPNGSGKSNVVDAIKWVLGEQSVKSLRGREMADVIFNGSGARRAMNSAEITLTFDNANRLLPVDTPEVHITRRVYRSGEGEYLLNRSPCRLRDIRDLLSGTGMGTQAYSVIEQGKVDVLLQSSSRDRRVIFEEAAGISRFKLKKIEALRRLERVDQNLLRLSDIVDEVDNRLRTVRAQAGKARRYKEYTDRLQELRTQVGLVDWRRLTERIGGFEEELQALAGQRDALAASAESIEAAMLEAEGQIGEINEAIRQAESRIAANRERIAAQESTIEHERSRAADLEEEIAGHRHRLLTLTARADGLQQQLHDTTEAVGQAEEHHRRIARLVTEAERALTELIARLDHFRAENEQRRASHLEQTRLAAGLASEISALESQASAAEAVRQRSRDRMADLDRRLGELATELDELRRRRDELARRAERHEGLAAEVAEQLAQLQQRLAEGQSELNSLRQRHTAAAERAAVLEELERRQEGLSAGVKEALAQARNPGDGPFKAVCGLVADLLCVSVEAAPLVDVALGQAAQHLAAAPSKELLEHLQSQSQRMAGRVGFVWLDGHGSPESPQVDLEGRPGVLGRADRFVETQPRYRPPGPATPRPHVDRGNTRPRLGAFPLGRARIELCHPRGRVLEADGTLVVGPRQAAAGLISRRSQLRALKGQLTELEGRIAQAEAAVAGVQERIVHCQEEHQRRTDEFRRALAAVAEHRLKISTAEERRASSTSSAAPSMKNCRPRCERTRPPCSAWRKPGKSAAGSTRTWPRRNTRWRAWPSKSPPWRPNARRPAAKLPKPRSNWPRARSGFAACTPGCGRSRTVGKSGPAPWPTAQEQLAQCILRAEACRWNILRAESDIAELYIRKEAFRRRDGPAHRPLRDPPARADASWPPRRKRSAARFANLRSDIHAQDLAANELRHERTTLVERLREDYGIDLGEVEHQSVDQQEHEREAVQEEIDDLRRKINAIGSVNLEALEELDSLESRHENLSRQFKDLSNAKAALEKIIDKINTDSRRLFSETLQTVREHFQLLFRDLFGGGHADIVLEEAVDILESGVEIVARPPGKEPRSISLLSGGEKTLTCVALLWPSFAVVPVRSACWTRLTRRWTRRTSTASPRSFATSSPGRSSSLSPTRRRR